MSVIIAADEVREPLYCIVPLFDPWRWKSRYKHTTRAIKHFTDSGAVVILVEIAFNRRELVFADSGLDGSPANCDIHGPEFKHRYLSLRTKDELWLKENSINVAVSQMLPYKWQQVCWLDSDILFLRPNWVGECIQKLQHYKFLQMFSHARDAGPNYELLAEDYPHAAGVSWVKAWQDDTLVAALKSGGKIKKSNSNGYAGRVWPGLAWACTREAWDQVGGLVDFAVWGGADWSMSHALIEKYDSMMHSGLHPNYKALMNAWAEKCRIHIRKNVGMMEGSVFHFWHGPKTERGYGVKHKLLADIGFDPIRHLKRDYQGLWQLQDTGDDAYVQLRDSMRIIAKSRDEDSNYVGIERDGQGH